MKRLWFFSAWLLLQLDAVGQGTILFDTHVPGIVDSKWFFNGAEADTYAKFGSGLLLHSGMGLDAAVRLYPTTTLKTSPASEMGYVEPVVVTVPGFPPGTEVHIWDYIFLLSNPNQVLGMWDTHIVLGGGDFPPAYLTGLPAEMGFIPEPTPLVLFGIGSVAALLFLRVSGVKSKTVGRLDGRTVGRLDGWTVGRLDGRTVGRSDGGAVGRLGGRTVGRSGGAQGR